MLNQFEREISNSSRTSSHMRGTRMFMKRYTDINVLVGGSTWATSLKKPFNQLFFSADRRQEKGTLSLDRCWSWAWFPQYINLFGHTSSAQSTGGLIPEAAQQTHPSPRRDRKQSVSAQRFICLVSQVCDDKNPIKIRGGLWEESV